jgi:hypothetical protein
VRAVTAGPMLTVAEKVPQSSEARDRVPAVAVPAAAAWLAARVTPLDVSAGLPMVLSILTCRPEALMRLLCPLAATRKARMRL